MPGETRITGGERMAAIGAELKALGPEGGVLRREMLAGLRVAAQPLAIAVRNSARQTLPREGGLNDWVAGANITVRNSLSARSAGVRIVATKAGGSKGSHDLEAIDLGEFRHPVFGNRSVWVGQTVTPGFFTKPLEDAAPLVEGALVKVLDTTIERIGVAE